MEISVRLFARARQLAGRDTIILELPDVATVGHLRAVLAEQYPALGALVARSLIAVNSEYVPDDRMVEPSDEVGCIPPVSGG